MTFHDRDNNQKTGILSRHRKSLLVAVFGMGMVGALAGNFVLSSSVTPAYAQSEAMPAQPGGFADIVQKVRPAVVSIKVKTERSSAAGDEEGASGGQVNPFEFFFNGPGGGGMPQSKPRKQFGMALGSGFFISADGYVVTNNHVVDKAAEVDVVTDAGKTYTAKVIGVDPRTDLALLKVNDDAKFPFVDLELKNEPRVGDWVLAVGNPYGLGGTVTAGIVSARGRDLNNSTYNDFLQIDAPVNRGNSGGPTFDLAGRVIGVNTAIYSPSGGSIGIGFAIPADTVSRVVSQLKSDGQVTRGYIGVQIQPVTQDIADSLGLSKASGALIADLTRNGPASKAGLQAGDVITQVNGKDVADSRELARAIADVKPGETANLNVWRDGKEQKIKVETAKLPSEKQMAANSSQDDDGGKSSLTGLGLQLAPASAVPGAGKNGVVVTDVDPSSAAAESLRAGDVILDVAGKPVNNVKDVRQILSDARSDNKRTVLLRVKNGEGMRFVALSVGKA